jgi:hypothetical protein
MNGPQLLMIWMTVLPTEGASASTPEHSIHTLVPIPSSLARYSLLDDKRLGGLIGQCDTTFSGHLLYGVLPPTTASLAVTAAHLNRGVHVD